MGIYLPGRSVCLHSAAVALVACCAGLAHAGELQIPPDARLREFFAGKPQFAEEADAPALRETFAALLYEQPAQTQGWLEARGIRTEPAQVEIYRAQARSLAAGPHGSLHASAVEAGARPSAIGQAVDRVSSGLGNGGSQASRAEPHLFTADIVIGLTEVAGRWDGPSALGLMFRLPVSRLVDAQNPRRDLDFGVDLGLTSSWSDTGYTAALDRGYRHVGQYGYELLRNDGEGQYSTIERGHDTKGMNMREVFGGSYRTRQMGHLAFEFGSRLTFVIDDPNFRTVVYTQKDGYRTDTPCCYKAWDSKVAEVVVNPETPRRTLGRVDRVAVRIGKPKLPSLVIEAGRLSHKNKNVDGAKSIRLGVTVPW